MGERIRKKPSISFNELYISLFILHINTQFDTYKTCHAVDEGSHVSDLIVDDINCIVYNHIKQYVLVL